MLTRRLELAPEPSSAGAARREVRTVLAEAGRADWRDAAELAVSEIVTNAILHARTAITLTVTVTDRELLVEVADQDVALPEVRHYGEQATTGRGMALVAELTPDFGVRALAEGKVVWFRMQDEARAAADAVLQARVDAVRAPEPPHAHRDVVLLGVPPALWFGARIHHEALLRELALTRPARPVDRDVDAARNAVWTALESAVEGIGSVDRSGLAALPLTVDLVLPLPEVAAEGFAAFQDVLDEGEELARQGRLLAAPALPEVVAVRDWLCEQVIAQLTGAPPAPWGGTDAFADDVQHEVRDLGWDLGLVRDAAVGAVAVNDGNRILAVSRPFLAALGWTEAELVGRRVVALVPKRYREAHVAGFTRHLATGQARVLGRELVLPVLQGDGGELPCRIRIEAQRSTTGHRVFVAWIDPELSPHV